MTSYYRRMMGVVRSEGAGAAYRLGWRDAAKRKAKRQQAKKARQRNRK